MKKKLRIFSILLICVILAVIVAFFINQNTNKENININQGIDIYYLEGDVHELSSEKYNIVGKSREEIVENALKTMKSKAKNEKLVSAVPDYVKLIDVTVDQNTALINFNKEYENMTKSEEMYCRSAVIKTVMGIYFVDKAEIFVDGKPLLKTNGEPLGAISGDDIIIDDTIEAEPITSVKVITLYFAKSDFTGLNHEERRIEINRNQPIEKYVVEELIKGSQIKGNISTIPSETKVRNIMTQDGICYVDLSSDFVTKQGTSGNELLTIYSIVDSLTALDDVRKVQFLIEGEKQDKLNGNIEFGQPFEAKAFETKS